VVNSPPSVITIHNVIPEARPDLCSPGLLGFWRARIRRQ
jgi:hypothetical protein